MFSEGIVRLRKSCLTRKALCDALNTFNDVALRIYYGEFNEVALKQV